jgi:glycosyltransferase involved in cell wall biosynthesis
METVSVIIPLYNAGESLHLTMKSLLAQTYPQLDIIIIDDGSQDNSFTIAKEYESNNVRVFQQLNAGAAVARNTGMTHAKGSYIQFLDAGDMLSPTKIEEQVKVLILNPKLLAVCNYLQFTHEDELINAVYHDQSSFIYSTNNPQEFLIRLWGGYGKMNFIQTNCWLVPKNLIDKVGQWRSYKCPDDDGEYFTRIILASNGILFTPEVYNYYRIAHGGEGQLSKRKTFKYLMNTLLTIDLKHHQFLNCGNHQLLKKAIAAQYFRFAIDMFPSQKVLSAIAWKRFKSFGQKAPKIIIGGKSVQIIYGIFGWRIARLLRYYLRGE